MSLRPLNRLSLVSALVVCATFLGCSSEGETPEASPEATLSPNPEGSASALPMMPQATDSAAAPMGPPDPMPSQSGTAPVTPSGQITSAMPSAPAPTLSPDPSVVPSEQAPSASTAPPDLEPPEEPPPTLLGDVTFSVPSGTFEGEFTVTLGGPEGTEIRYTTDGTLPTAESALYDGAAITIAATTQLRAASFSGGSSGFVSTAIYVQRTFDTPSDIPIVIMEGYGGGRPQKVTSGFGGNDMPDEGVDVVAENNKWYDVAFMLFEPAGGVASIADVPTLVTRAGYRERGQSSAGAEKSPYRVEFWNNNNEDADYPVLGMPADADWAMIGEFYDKTQIRNSLVYHWGAQMGLQTMDRRFAELYINFDGGPLEESDYFGVYAITETIKNQDDRIDINNLKLEENTEPAISGGYIMKFDQAALDDNEPVIECTGSAPFEAVGGLFGGGGPRPQVDAGSGEAGHCFQYLGIVDPPEVSPEQLTWITNYVQAFHDALHVEPMGDYGQYIDVPSFIDHLLIGELTMNVDAFVRSQYFTKDREGLIKAGPLWDYNFSLGSVGTEVEGWHAEAQATGRGNDDWFYKLEQDPAFIAQAATRWRELRQGLLSDATVMQTITDLTLPLVNAGARDLARWPEGLGGFFGGQGGGEEEPEPDTYEGHVQVLRDFTLARMAWLDEALGAY